MGKISNEELLEMANKELKDVKEIINDVLHSGYYHGIEQPLKVTVNIIIKKLNMINELVEKMGASFVLGNKKVSGFAEDFKFAGYKFNGAAEILEQNSKVWQFKIPTEKVEMAKDDFEVILNNIYAKIGLAKAQERGE